MNRMYIGDIENLPHERINSIRMYISSSDDMAIEKSFLKENIIPKLQEISLSLGMELQVIDLKWEKNNLYNQHPNTVQHRLNLLENYTKSSNFDCYIMLLDERCGHQSLPKAVPGDEFEKLIRVLKESGDDVQLLEKFYKKDKNKLQSEFVLQIDRNWEVNELENYTDSMNSLLKKAANLCVKKNQMPDNDAEKYLMSDLEREIRAALFDISNTKHQTACFIRKYQDVEHELRHKHGLLSHGEINMSFDNEIDSNGNSVNDYFPNVLLEKIRKLLDLSNFNALEVPMKEGGINCKHLEHKLYLRQLGESFKQVSTRLIQNIANNRKPHTLENRNDLFNEVLFHSKLVSEKSDSFYSREELIEEVQKVLIDSKQKHDKEPIVIHGVEGSGKTSLMSTIIKKASLWLEMSSLNVIFRMIGTTPCSDDIENLIFSLCQQIVLIYQQPMISKNTFEDYETLLQYFYQLLRNLEFENYPLMIVIDSLESLHPSNNAHLLNWLPKKLGKNLYFVVSTNSKQNDIFNRLKDRFQNQSNFIEVSDFNDQSAAIILKNFVTKYQRKLNDEQLHYVTQCARKCRNPLYINITVAEVLSWKSYNNIENFPLNISDFIYFVMEKLEEEFGEVFVSHTLSYITASKCGMSENELQDVLSLDNYVMSEIYNDSELLIDSQVIDCDLSHENKRFWILSTSEADKSIVLRLPAILWKQLFEKLKPYVISFDIYGTKTYNWGHRIFKDVATEKYLNDSKTVKIIFSNLVDFYTSVYANSKPKQIVLDKIDPSKYWNCIRLVQSQPNYYNPQKCNIRKMQELPHALNNLKDQKNLFKEVTFNFEFLKSKVTAVSLNNVIKDIKLVMDSTNDREVEILHDTLKLSSHHVKQNSDALACELIARLKGYCGEEHEKITSLVHQAQNYITNSNKEVMLVRNSSMVPAGGDEHFTCLGQQGEIVDIKCFGDSNRVLLLSVDERSNANLHLWNIVIKQCTKKLTYKCADVSPKFFMEINDNYVILLADYTYVIDMNKDNEWQIESETAELQDMAYHESSNRVAFYTKNKTIKFYDIANRAFVKTFKPEFQGFELMIFVGNSGNMFFSKCEESLGLFFEYDTNEVNSVQFNKRYVTPEMKVYDVIANGDYVIMGIDSLIFVLDSPTYSIHKKFSEHSDRISTLINIQNDIFASASYDQTIKTWSISRKVVLKTFEGHDAPITTLTYCNVNDHLISGSKDSFIRVWDRQTGDCLKGLFGHRKKIKALKATPNGDFFVSGSADKSVKIWRTQGSDSTQPTFIYHDKKPIDISMSLDEKYIATISEDELILWDEISSKIIKKVQEKCCCLTFTNDCHFLLVGTKTGFVNAYDVTAKSLSLIFSYKAHGKEVTKLECLREKSKILSGGMDGSLFMFNIYERRVIQIFKNHSGAVTCLKLSPDKNFIISGSADGLVNVYEKQKEYQCLHKLEGHEKPITCIDISKNNKYVVSGSEDSYIFIWYVSTGLNFNRIKCNNDSIVKSVAFYGTAISALAATAGKTSQLKSWEPNTGECIKTFDGHTDTVNYVAITEDQNYFLTCSKDGLVGLWKAATTTLLDKINFDSEVLSIVISKSHENSHYKAAIIVANGTVSLLHIYLPLTVHKEMRKDDRLKLIEDMRHRMDTLTEMKTRGCLCCVKYFT